MIRTIFIIICVLITQSLSAQTLTPMVISSSGGFYSNATGMLSFTTGEMTMIETFSSVGNFLTQGFQQPEDYGVGIEDHFAVPNSIEIYPNPASDLMILYANFTEPGILDLKIVNEIGQEVMNLNSINIQQGTCEKTFNLENLCSGIYFLKTAYTSKSHHEKNATLKLIIVK